MMKVAVFLVLICPVPIQDAWIPGPLLDEIRLAVEEWEIDSKPIYAVPLLQQCFWESITLPPGRDADRFNLDPYGPMSVADQFIEHCLTQADLEPWRAEGWVALVEECRGLRRCWVMMAEIKQTYILGKRRALGKLRDMIGHEAYTAGVMPPPVPVWRFRRIDP